MKIIKILKYGADKLISVLRIKKPFLHNYKYCTSVHIHADVNNILKKHRAIEKTAVKIKQATH